MSLLCRIGLHRWGEQSVLEQTLSSGLKIILDAEVCRGCDKLRDPENFADVYALMTNNVGRIIAHPAVTALAAPSAEHPVSNREDGESRSPEGTKAAPCDCPSDAWCLPLRGVICRKYADTPTRPL